MFYLTTHSTHFIYGYMGVRHMVKDHSDSEREETRCRHIGYSFRLAARVLLYAPSHRQDDTYHGICYTSRGALAGTRNSSMEKTHSEKMCAVEQLIKLITVHIAKIMSHTTPPPPPPPKSVTHIQ